MKKIAVPRRIIVTLALLTLILVALDLMVHHHAEVSFLPHFGLYHLISLGSGIIFIALARTLVPLLSRKEDYYDR
ncbi:MAG: hypothetical protein BA874_10030 [Desulfuromonadales bacterium C00003068]|jgi:predicted tellurium resistance membrane protein TerC|nr:MAG: hypothetical protein BA874_10030 [Desulfuromonadales bacterium C00003068]